MSILHSLELSGIRSYDSTQPTVINISSPLTIVVGPTGSGKTAILEALRIAATGELPNNVKGIDFIYDPVIRSQKRTDASVRLKFTDANGVKQTLRRCFSLSATHSGAEWSRHYRAGERIIKRRGNTPQRFNNKSIDREMSRLLGVSKPVLDSVVFVRQEDSLWPLGDVGDMKEHMDSIVAATRYATVLEKIRSCKTDKDVELVKVMQDVDKLSARVQDLDKLKVEMERVTQLREQVKMDIQALDGQLSRLDSEHETADAVAKQHAERYSELKKLRGEKEWIEKLKMEKKSNISNYLSRMSELALNTEIEELKSSLERRGRLTSDLAGEIETLDANIKLEDSQKLELQGDARILKHEIDHHIEQMTRLEQLKDKFLGADIFSNTGINPMNPGPIALPPRTASVKDWTRALLLFDEQFKEREKALLNDSENRKNNASAKLNDVRSRSQIKRTNMKRRSKDLRDKENQLSETQRDLSSMTIPQGSLEDARRHRDSLHIPWMQNKRREAQTKRDLQSYKSELQEMENRLKELEKTHGELTKDREECARFRARFLHQREVETEKKKNASELLNDLTDLISSSIADLGEQASKGLRNWRQSSHELATTADSLSPINAQTTLQELLEINRKLVRRKDKVLRDAQNLQTKKEAARNSASGLKDGAEAQLRTILGKAMRLEKNVRNKSINLKDIPENFFDEENRFDNRAHMGKLFPDIPGFSSRTEFQLQDAQLNFIARAMTKAESKIQEAGAEVVRLETGALHAARDLEDFMNHPNSQCPACGLSEPSKVEDMRSRLESRVQYYKDSRNMKRARKKLRELEQTRAPLKRVHDVLSKALPMKSEVDSAKATLEEIESRLLICEEEMENAQETYQLANARLGHGTIERVNSKSKECEQALETWEKAREQVADAEARLTGDNDIRSADEVYKKLCDVRELLRCQRKSIDRTSGELEEFSQTASRYYQAKLFFSELQKQTLELQERKQQESNLSMSVETEKAEIERLGDNIERLEGQLGDAVEKFNEVKTETDAALNEVISSRRRSSSALDRWKTSVGDVPQYSPIEKQQQLSGVISSLQNTMAELDSRESQLKSLKEDQKLRFTIHNLKSNLEFRLREKELRNNAQDIQKTELEIQRIRQNANGDPPSIVKGLIDEIRQKGLEKANKESREGSYCEELEKLRTKLNELEEEELLQKFNQCRIEKQTLELASKDLETYFRAVNQSLITFHTLKVKSINRTIRELWHETVICTGNDIDDIEITADGLEIDSRTTLRRMFKYEVQMRQGQSKVDMRGRCSAGQKVLACLVIRLALAENFSKDLGILALDQPTANLDREHVGSLAVALRKIIQNRRARGNFQLLLFTHDQEFIDMLGAQDYCDNCYVVSKDADGFSNAHLKCLQEL